MKADRRDFFKISGILGTATLIPLTGIAKLNAMGPIDNTCILIPTETAGPFPLDLTDNPFFFRQDVREDRTGVQLNLKMKIFGLENCAPMQNVRVHIWHCDKDGNYSGYGSETGLTYLRGWQMTDANGEVEFITILPGWYPGRVCHIHFQVWVSSMYSAISQLTFPEDTKNDIYIANEELYAKGPDPVPIPQDAVFADGYEYQLCTLTPNDSAGGYDSYLEVTVNGSGTVGVGYLEKETEKQFTIGQNYPNPFTGSTTIPFRLVHPGDVTLELWNLNGIKIKQLEFGNLSQGDHEILVNLASLGIEPGNYLYQLGVNNKYGTFRLCRMMTSSNSINH